MTMTSKDLSRLGNAIRIGVVILYVLGVGTGYFFLDRKRVDIGNLQFVATRPLPAGYRVQPGDIDFKPKIAIGDQRSLRPEWNPVGKYLANAHNKNDAFGPGELSSAPVIKLAPGAFTYSFSLENQKELSKVLNTDSHLDVCAVTCVIQNARVASIVCPDSDPAQCFAVLELTGQQAQFISGTGKENYRLVLRGD
jgi:hypothetical protein